MSFDINIEVNTEILQYLLAVSKISGMHAGKFKKCLENLKNLEIDGSIETSPEFKKENDNNNKEYNNEDNNKYENSNTFILHVCKHLLNKHQKNKGIKISWVEVEKDLTWAIGKNCHLISWFDPRYPQQLKEIPDPPLLLYLQGNPNILARLQLAIVGSRNPTPLGKEIAENFAYALGSLGIGITSGLAIGIDTEAHRGALKTSGGTIAVLGSGFKNIYPKSNQKLADLIIENKHGALVSEFSPDTVALSKNFPKRNRIISGLSLGTLVIEAALKSGSLITARFANEQGREVFAVPGSIYSPFSQGCNQLIKQGAKLIENVPDVLEELNELTAHLSNLLKSKDKLKQFDNGIFQKHNHSLSKDGPVLQPKGFHSLKKLGMSNENKLQFLLFFIGFEPLSIDKIIEKSQLTPEEVSIMLLELELQGALITLPGGVIRRGLVKREELVSDE